MITAQQRLQFRLSHLFWVVLWAACVVGSFRVHPSLAFLAVWVAYAAGLLYVMARFQWSDAAMSVCGSLILLPFIFALLVPVAWP